MDQALKIGMVLTAKDSASPVVNKMIANAKAKFASIKKMGDNLSKLANPLLIAGAAITAFYTKTVADARDAILANTRLENVFKNMGDTTGALAKQGEAFADKFQFKIGIEDETIKDVESKLAIFNTVLSKQGQQAQLLQRLTTSAFNMQAIGFGEATSNAVLLGKAIEDPIKGMSVLRRSGVTFSNEQQAKIKQLIATNQKFAAQQLIVNAVEDKFKNAAEANADPLAKLHIAGTELSETFGKAVYPALTKAANKLADWIPKIQAFLEKHPGLIKALALIGVSLLAVGTAFKVVGFIMSTNPLIFLITAIALAALLIYKNWGGIKAFFIRIGQAIANAWHKVVDWFSAQWQRAKNLFMMGVNFIKKIFLNFTPLGIIIKNWSKITGFFSNLWDGVKNVFNNVVDWIKGIGSRFYDAGANIINSIVDGIKSKIKAVTDTIKGIAQKIRDFLPFSPAKVGPLKTLHKVKIAETIAQTIKPAPVVSAMQRMTGQAAGVLNNPIPVYNNGGNNYHFNPVINLSGSATQRDADMIAQTTRKDFDRWIREYDQSKQRVKF